jgi:hypothetical protein
MPRQLSDGSTASAYTSFPTVNEAHAVLGVTVEELRLALTARGISANPDDRFPMEVMAAAVDAAGVPRQVLGRLRAPGQHFLDDRANPNRRWR